MKPSELRSRFEDRGFVGALSAFDARTCRRIMRILPDRRARQMWSKESAALSGFFYDLGTYDPIVDRVAELIGEDVLLWGAKLVRRRPGQVHAWHTDVETAGSVGRTVTVWIGLEHTNRRSSLEVIPYSHHFGLSVQQVASEAGLRRKELTSDEVLHWARLREARCLIEQPVTGNGQLLLFDGRLWHGSFNTNRRTTRTALLLQYATPETPIRLPDPEAGYEWPFRFLDEPRPPCILVRGTDGHGVNALVPGPPARQGGASPRVAPGPSGLWPSWVRCLPPTLVRQTPAEWQRYPIFRGSTRSLKQLGCHLSILPPGIVPHPPHLHAEEELLVMLSGAAEVLLQGGGPSEEVPDAAETVHRIAPGWFSYYAAFQRHTIRAVGPEPACYVVFKWRADGRGKGRRPLGSGVFHPGEWLETQPALAPEPMARQRLLDSPTRYLGRLRSHVRLVQPGEGYPAHRDDYDVAIVVLQGMIETLGRRVGPNGVIYYAAGELHGLRNVGTEPASYLVFEFHGGRFAPRIGAVRARTLPRLLRRVRRAAARRAWSGHRSLAEPSRRGEHR